MTVKALFANAGKVKRGSRTSLLVGVMCEPLLMRRNQLNDTALGAKEEIVSSNGIFYWEFAALDGKVSPLE